MSDPRQICFGADQSIVHATGQRSDDGAPAAGAVPCSTAAPLPNTIIAVPTIYAGYLPRNRRPRATQERRWSPVRSTVDRLTPSTFRRRARQGEQVPAAQILAYGCAHHQHGPALRRRRQPVDRDEPPGRLSDGGSAPVIIGITASRLSLADLPRLHCATRAIRRRRPDRSRCGRYPDCRPAALPGSRQTRQSRPRPVHEVLSHRIFAEVPARGQRQAPAGSGTHGRAIDRSVGHPDDADLAAHSVKGIETRVHIARGFRVHPSDSRHSQSVRRSRFSTRIWKRRAEAAGDGMPDEVPPLSPARRSTWCSGDRWIIGGYGADPSSGSASTLADGAVTPAVRCVSRHHWRCTDRSPARKSSRFTRHAGVLPAAAGSVRGDVRNRLLATDSRREPGKIAESASPRPGAPAR